jgi:SHS2 domain-containing protein
LGASGGYRLLEHVTDAFVEAWGETLEEAFSQAGRSLFDTMLEVKSVRTNTNVEIQTSGHDEKELLYNYLEELLLLFEVKQLALGEFSVGLITPTLGEIRLEGKAGGEPYDRTRHNGKVEVKGITYHLMEIEKHPRKVTVRFLLDL